MIPYGRQSIDKKDIAAVVSALRSPFITQGPMVERFEEAFAAYCRAPYAVAVSSGTAGLHLASLAAGFGPGDEVVTTPMSFVATANAILYCHARPRFVDIENRSLGLDPAKIKNSISARTKGIIPVHFAGQPCLIGEKEGLSDRKDFFIIDDACHALGAEVYRGGQWKKIGGTKESDMTVFSFHPVKHITTGEGGMITTHRKDLQQKLISLRSHGIEKDRKRFLNKTSANNPWYYEMQSLGFNYRITDIQCALGLSQLKKIHGFVKKRREIAEFYDKKFKDIGTLKTPEKIEGRRSSYHLYALRIDFKSLGISRRQVMEKLQKKGIATQVHYIPIIDQPYYQKLLRLKKEEYPVCQSYYEEALSIPMFPSMTQTEIKKVAFKIESLFMRSKCH